MVELFSLPGGVLVTDSLVSLPPKLLCCIPVILKNESHHHITLPTKSVIAEIYAVKSVQPVKTPDSDPPTKPDQKVPISSNSLMQKSSVSQSHLSPRRL